MLMPEVAALGEAAHVQVVMAFVVPEMGAAAADHGWRLPLGLDRPAMENGLAFVAPRNGFFSAVHGLTCLCSIIEHQFVLRPGSNPLSSACQSNRERFYSMTTPAAFTSSPDYVQSLARG